MTSLPGSPKMEELLRLLLEQGKDHALLLLDAEDRVVGWLAGAEHIFGYRAEEMLGQPVSRLFTTDDVKRGLSEHELEVTRKNGRAEDDRWRVRKDGTWIWASGVVITLRNTAGELIGFGKILRDRTDIKAQIEALENRADGIGQRCRPRP